MRIVQVFKQGGRTVRRVYTKKKPGRPKGTRNTTYNLTADGLARKQVAARKVANRLHKEGRAGSGHFKYHEYPQEGVEKCRQATLRKIAEGTLDPAENIRKFIKAGGSPKYWNSRVNHGTHGMFYSTKNKKRFRYDSSWELERMKYLETDDTVVSYRKNPVQIPYALNGQAHYYFPDFMVEYVDGSKVLEEIKPPAFLNDPKNIEKVKVARLFCRRIGVKFRILSSRKELET
jgi:hypothetical protein